MTTTPTLPPYPKPDIIDGEPYWFDRHMEAYALAAYQAGRDAGLSDGFDAGFAHSGEGYNGEHPSGVMNEPDYAVNKDEAIRAMKSDAKGGA